MTRKASIPAGLPINEEARLLAYCKVKFESGFMFKSDLQVLSRRYGKDPRTLKKYLRGLIKAGLIGECERAFYFRSWRYITGKEKFNLQSFKASLAEIKDKTIFEGLLFGAKVTSIGKAIRRGRVRVRGCTDQSPSSGFLAKACKISQGKVTQLKRKASSLDLISIEKRLADFGEGTPSTANILKKEVPGIFLKNGRLKRRQADRIFSKVGTFRIKNRKVSTDNNGAKRRGSQNQ